MPRVRSNDPLQAFKFRVSMNGIPSAMGFKKVNGLSKELGVIEYDEGGYDYTHKLNGKMKTGEVTLEKGMFANKDIETLISKSFGSEEFRDTLTVDLLDATGKVARNWNLAEAWVSKWEAGELDASSEDVVIETLTIQYEYFLD